MAHLELSKAPVQELTPQEQKRVIAMVDRMWQQRKQLAWIVWTALYRLPLRKSGICNPRKRTNGTGKIAGTCRCIRVSREQLAGFETPSATATWKPLPHHVLVDAIHEEVRKPQHRSCHRGVCHSA